MAIAESIDGDEHQKTDISTDDSGLKHVLNELHVDYSAHSMHLPIDWIDSKEDWVALAICNPQKKSDIDSFARFVFVIEKSERDTPDRFFLNPSFARLDPFIHSTLKNTQSPWENYYGGIHVQNPTAREPDLSIVSEKQSVSSPRRVARWARAACAPILLLAGVAISTNESAMQKVGSGIGKGYDALFTQVQWLRSLLGKTPETKDDFQERITESRGNDDVEGTVRFCKMAMKKFEDDPSSFEEFYGQAVSAYTSPPSGVDKSKVHFDWKKGYRVAYEGLNHVRTKAKEPTGLQQDWKSKLSRFYETTYDTALGMSEDHSPSLRSDGTVAMESVLHEWRQDLEGTFDARLERHLLELSARKIVDAHDPLVIEQLSHEGLRHAWLTCKNGMVSCEVLGDLRILIHNDVQRELLFDLSETLDKSAISDLGKKDKILEAMKKIFADSATPEEAVEGLCAYSRKIRDGGDVSVAGKDTKVE